MSFIRAYDVVSEVVAEACKQFGSRWSIQASAIERINADCTLVDQLVSEFCCESIEATVDEGMNLHISIVCPDIVVDYGSTHPFFRLIEHTSSFHFSAIDDSLKIDFVFSGVWQLSI